ncbi:MAG: multidrug MFS transporter [Waddliaceae bacterium]|nr:multidrug MFS transporter [Waddliaceae bacterium]
MKKHLFLFVFAFFVSGCNSVGPDYQSPVVETSNDWLIPSTIEKHITAEEGIDLKWWEQLNDPQLTALIEKAVQYNLDIKIAELNIFEARALRGISVASDYPNLDARANIRREGLSETAGLPAGKLAGIPTKRNFYDMGFDASWELDIWGKKQRTIEAANARLDSYVEKRNDILLLILSETARNYIELRGAQKQLAIIETNLQALLKKLDIVQQRYELGDSDQREVSKAEIQLRNIQALLPSYQADIRSAIYRIALLTGEEAQTLLDILLEYKPLSNLPDIVPVGLKSDLLQRRPDIRLAERNLAAETADIGIKTADLFPSFSLTGSAGLQSLSFGDLFQSNSSTWALGPKIQWPIFKGGEIRNRIKVEETQAEAAGILYEKTVLNAFSDVETGLLRYGKELETHENLKKALIASRQNEELAKQSHESGEDNLLAFIDAQNERIQAEDRLAQSETKLFLSLITLYKALGGGWDTFLE